MKERDEGGTESSKMIFILISGILIEKIKIKVKFLINI